MLTQSLGDLALFYRSHLLENVVTFWERHSLDREYGGNFSSLDRTSAVYDGDEAVWLQGRAAWMFSKLYNTVERRQAWLDAARQGYDFLVRHAFDSDGRLFFSLTRESKPPTQLEWDMKLWWPHTEALYATLLAYYLTGEWRYADWFAKIHDWSFGLFADPEYGEWYGYLHCDGSVSTPLKGGTWKGFFHLPRALWSCMRLLDQNHEGSTQGAGT